MQVVPRQMFTGTLYANMHICLGIRERSRRSAYQQTWNHHQSIGNACAAGPLKLTVQQALEYMQVMLVAKIEAYNSVLGTDGW